MKCVYGKTFVVIGSRSFSPCNEPAIKYSYHVSGNDTTYLYAYCCAHAELCNILDDNDYVISEQEYNLRKILEK